VVVDSTSLVRVSSTLGIVSGGEGEALEVLGPAP